MKKSSIRKCKQCGEVKQLTKDFFRPYYGENATGFYRTCKLCESINNRYKYLTGKGDAASEVEQEEIASMLQLYEILRDLGLQPPRYGAQQESSTLSLVDELLKRKSEDLANIAATLESAGLEDSGASTAELLAWLTEPLIEEPEFYDDVYYTLREKYMPIIGMGSNNLPIHCDKHAETLTTILKRFNDYEDNYVYD